MIWINAIILIIIGYIASQYEEMDYFWLFFGVYMVALVVYNTLSLYFIPEYKKRKNGMKILKEYIESEKNSKLKNFILEKYTIDKRYDYFPEQNVFTLTLIPKNKKEVGIPDFIKVHVYKKRKEVKIFEYWINRLRYSKESGVIKKWFMDKNYQYYNLQEDQKLEFKNEFFILNHLDELIERANISIKKNIIKAFYVSILFGVYIGSIFLVKNILELDWVDFLDPKAMFLIFVGLAGIIFSLPFLTVYKEDRIVDLKNHIEKTKVNEPDYFCSQEIISENYKFYKKNYIHFDEIKELNYYIYKLVKDKKYLPTYILINPFTEEKLFIWGLELFSTVSMESSRDILKWLEKENIHPLDIESEKDKIYKSDIKTILEKSNFN